MSFRELHTAAVNVVHIERAADLDTDLLRLRFGIHPTDAESTLTPAVESSFSSYQSYGYLTMLWPSHDDVSEIRFFIDRRVLIIIGDTSTHLFQRHVEKFQADTGTKCWQMNGPELLIELLHDIADNEQPAPNRANAVRIDNLTVALRQCGTWMQTDFRNVVPRMILLAHKLDLMSDRLRATASDTTAANTPAAVPQIVRGYAMAAAVMVVGVIVTLSLR